MCAPWMHFSSAAWTTAPRVRPLEEGLTARWRRTDSAGCGRHYGRFSRRCASPKHRHGEPVCRVPPPAIDVEADHGVVHPIPSLSIEPRGPVPAPFGVLRKRGCVRGSRRLRGKDDTRPERARSGALRPDILSIGLVRRKKRSSLDITVAEKS